MSNPSNSPNNTSTARDAGQITAIERSGSTQDHYWRAPFGQPADGATLKSLIHEGDELIERPDLIGATQVPHTRIVQIKSSTGVYAGTAGRFFAIHDAGPALDTFTRAYIECALWSSLDDSCNPLDANYSASDIAPETLARMIQDCAQFQRENNIDGYGITQAGHDFWLTRNGHGCGFWEEDHGTPEQCALLDKASEAFGSFDLYIGDDKQIHGQ